MANIVINCTHYHGYTDRKYGPSTVTVFNSVVYASCAAGHANCVYSSGTTDTALMRDYTGTARNTGATSRRTGNISFNVAHTHGSCTITKVATTTSHYSKFSALCASSHTRCKGEATYTTCVKTSGTSSVTSDSAQQTGNIRIALLHNHTISGYDRTENVYIDKGETIAACGTGHANCLRTNVSSVSATKRTSATGGSETTDDAPWD